MLTRNYERVRSVPNGGTSCTAIGTPRDQRVSSRNEKKKKKREEEEGEKNRIQTLLQRAWLVSRVEIASKADERLHARPRLGVVRLRVGFHRPDLNTSINNRLYGKH